MSAENPYQPPGADVQKPVDGAYDQTSPFSPKGRFGRLSYLAWYIIATLVFYVLLIPLAFVGAIDPNSMTAVWIQIGLSIPFLVVVILFAIRRLHDINASAWWLLLGLVPIVNIGLGFVMLFKRGTEGANRFGPARFTPTWERVVGIIAAVLTGLSLVLGIGAAIYLGMHGDELFGQAGMY